MGKSDQIDAWKAERNEQSTVFKEGGTCLEKTRVETNSANSDEIDGGLKLFLVEQSLEPNCLYLSVWKSKRADNLSKKRRLSFLRFDHM